MTVDFFLDVDGVLNVLPDSHWLEKWGWGPDYAKGAVTLPYMGSRQEFTIRWSPALIKRLNALSASGVRFHWLTTWREWAPQHLPDLLGIDGADWPVLGMEEPSPMPADKIVRPREWWKLEEVIKHVSENPENRFVWVDDDIQIEKRSQEFIRQNTPMILGVSPDMRRGITPDLMDQIEKFVSEMS